MSNRNFQRQQKVSGSFQVLSRKYTPQKTAYITQPNKEKAQQSIVKQLKVSAYTTQEVTQQNGINPESYESEHLQQYQARIKVLGIGGGGSNAVNRMKSCGLHGIEHIAINTDLQALEMSLADKKLQIGQQKTRGLGTGGSPDIAAQAAREAEEDIKQMLKGADLAFITAGEGGGTGTGAAPIIAQISQEMGILTIGVITFPFKFEGRKRAKQAVDGISKLREHVDTLILVPNDRLLDITNRQVPLTEAFTLADDVLRQGVQGISDIITTPGLVNVDFADIREIMSRSGTAMLGVGTSTGKNKAQEAAEMAASVPLFEKSIERATGIIYNITGGEDMTLSEVSKVSETIQNIADEQANIIFGAVVEPNHKGRISVTVIATGFSQQYQNAIIFKNQGLKNRKGD